MKHKIRIENNPARSSKERQSPPIHWREMSLILFFAVAVTFATAAQVQATAVTEEESQLVCQNWITLMSTRGGEWSQADVTDIRDISDLRQGDTLLARCYNIAPSGFVVVPVLKELPPVMVSSQESRLDVTRADEESGIAKLVKDLLLNRIRLYINRYGNINEAQPDQGEVLYGRIHEQQWDMFAVSSKEFSANLDLTKDGDQQVGPLLTTSWVQTDPFNMLCPMGDGGRCLVGCVATAAAQIMAFWQWPTYGTGSHCYYWYGDGSVPGCTLCANFCDVYEWDDMTDSCDLGCTSSQEDAMAELCYEVGVAFEMDYHASGSGAWTSDAVNVFPTFFSYDTSITIAYRSDHTQENWFTVIQNQIDEGQPMQYRIYRHSIVCDGWRTISGVNQYHINYGWGGSHTAWFTIDDIYCTWPGCSPNVEYAVINIRPLVDTDGDGIADKFDNCDYVPNPNQANSDTDTLGNACDNCDLVDNNDQANIDSDTLGDVCDNCLFIANDDQADYDNDGLGDLCDTCLTPDPIFPTYWGSIFWANDTLPINLDWECTYASYFQVEVYEVQRDTIDDVDDLTNPVVQTILDTCTYNMWRDLPVYMDVYNWSSFYWRVRAACDSVGWSDWSEINHYKVYVTTPHLASPANGAEIEYTEDITLKWYKMPGGGSYRVQVDNNSDFSSPEIDTTSSDCPSWYCRYEIDPQLPNGKYYWRVYKLTFGDWSYTRYFRIISPPVTSCPVLFSYDGDRFVRENPLLTACEASNYTRIVTDYYQVTQQVQPRNGMITFQLKELEDEITYLEEFELVSVDHRTDTKVGCSVDGRIFTYREAVTPLSAVDHDGIDRLAAVSDADNDLFVSDEPGYLIVTFPASQDQGFVTLQAPIKLPCPFEDPGPGLPKTIADLDRMAAQVTLELLDSDGHWVTLPDLPSRQYAVDEIVLGSLPSTDDGEPTTVRISWSGSFATDRINQYLPADETPNVDTWAVSNYRLDRNQPTAKAWGGFDSGEILVMKKGDVLEAKFDCGEVQDPNLTRDYIIRAVGRYQPDYAVFTGLVPGAYQLYDAYPNPFNPTATISYDLPVASQVRLEVFNLLGQKVIILVDEFQNAGHYAVEWSMVDSGGGAVASGVYFCRLTAGNFSGSKKLILLK